MGREGLGVLITCITARLHVLSYCPASCHDVYSYSIALVRATTALAAVTSNVAATTYTVHVASLCSTSHTNCRDLPTSRSRAAAALHSYYVNRKVSNTVTDLGALHADIDLCIQLQTARRPVVVKLTPHY